MKTGISEESFKSAARELQCEIELIKAVDAKESRGGGFKKWRCKILFEPHILEIFVCRKTYSFKYLLSSLGTKPYGKESQQHAKLPVLINRDIALMSASWEDFRSWVLILKLVDANPFKNLSIK
jgi:hypothetical protein